MKIRFGFRLIGIILIFPMLIVALSLNSYSFMLDPIFDRDIQIDKISVSGFTVRSATVYDYFGSDFKKRTNISDIIYFNEQGFPSEKVFYTENGDVQKNEKYFYDDYSNLISVVILVPGDPTNYDMNFKYDKDANGKLVKRYAYNSEGILLSYYVYNYSNGNLVSEEKFSSDNTPISKIYYSYDNNNNLTKTSEFRISAGNPFIYLVHNYNSKGLIEQSTQFSNDGKVFWISDQKFDSNGNLVQSICKNSFGKLQWKYTLNYDDNNLIAEKIIYSDELTPYEKVVYNYENENETNNILGNR